MADFLSSAGNNTSFLPDLGRVATQLARQPSALPIHESGLTENGLKIPFAKVLSTLAPHADVVMVGDTDHFDRNVSGIMGRDENLQALKHSGYTHIGIEVSSGAQHMLDKYNSGKISRQEFETMVDRLVAVAQGNEDGVWTRQIGHMAEFSKKNGLALQFADPDNGAAPINPQLTGAAAKEAEIRKWKERFQDKDELGPLLAETTKGGGKTLLLYGSHHFSVDNGSREATAGRFVKVDVHASRKVYEEDKILHQQNAKDGINTNQLKPDAVYFLDTGTLHTTAVTSPAVKADLEKAAQAGIAPATPSAPSMQKTGMPMMP